MKRLFYLIVIVALPIIVFFQWDRYRRFHPPTDYAYPINSEIDIDYHDPEEVMNYYLTAAKAENYAKSIWKEHKIDVKMASPVKADEQEYAHTYNHIIASARFLEQKLLRSAQLKKEGYSNDDISALANGEPDQVEKRLFEFLDNPVIAEPGDQNSLVFEIQRILKEKGYEHPVDGIYRDETRRSVAAFQESLQMFASGTVDKKTLKRLLE